MTDTQKDELRESFLMELRDIIRGVSYGLVLDEGVFKAVENQVSKVIEEAEMRGRHKGIKNLYETIRGDDAEFSDDFVGKQFRNYVRGGGWDQPFKSNLTDK